MQDAFQDLFGNLCFERPQCRQRGEVLEKTTEKRRIPPSGDLEETRGLDAGRDPARVSLGFSVPSVHHGFGVKIDVVEGASLAPFPPSSLNERGVVEAGDWKVVDDLVDDLLGK